MCRLAASLFGQFAAFSVSTVNDGLQRKHRASEATVDRLDRHFDVSASTRPQRTAFLRQKRNNGARPRKWSAAALSSFKKFHSDNSPLPRFCARTENAIWSLSRSRHENYTLIYSQQHAAGSPLGTSTRSNFTIWQIWQCFPMFSNSARFDNAWLIGCRLYRHLFFQGSTQCCSIFKIYRII